jgi:hypothetical protein
MSDERKFSAVDVSKLSWTTSKTEAGGEVEAVQVHLADLTAAGAAPAGDEQRSAAAGSPAL